MSHACAPYLEAISAGADGETSPVPDADLARHLAGCGSCARFAADVDRLRHLRVAEAEPVPDLTGEILATLPVPSPGAGRQRLQRVRQLRVVLGLAGVVQLLLAVPVLLAPDALGAHLAREVGVFQLALGAGFLTVARRPSRAAGLLPVAAVVAGLVVATAFVDVLTGAATAVGESVHALEIVGTALVWALDRHPGTLRLQPTGMPA